MIMKVSSGSPTLTRPEPPRFVPLIVALAIAMPHGQIAAFCQRHHIKRLALFGSVRDESLLTFLRASMILSM
jgi:hypothetical protein